MKRTIVLSAVLLVLATTATGCSGNETPASPGSNAAPSTAVSTPSPTRAPLTEADLKEAMVTVSDLGKAWDASSGGSGAVPRQPDTCPQPERGTTELTADARLWQGFVSKTAGLTTALTAHPSPDAADYQAAYAADVAECASFTMKSGNDDYVVKDSAEGPTQVAGADEVLGSSVRRFYLDASGQPLVSSIQTLVCRKGSVIVEVGYGPYEQDPAARAKRAKDFGPITKIMQTQLEKVASTVGS